MSIMSDDNFSMSADKYLAKHKILIYLEDSVKQLLEHREENPKVVPAKFLCEYFCSLRDGNHTMFREINFIKSTPHTRASFVVLFWKCFRQIGRKGDLLSIQEYHSLLGLLCPDFPFQLVQKTARIVLIDDALDCLISFPDFIYAFQVQFYYEEFLEKCVEIYQGILQAMNSPRDPVIVPTSGGNDTKVHQNIHLPADGVDAMQFFRAIYPILDRVDYSTPKLSSLKEILYNVPRISFYEFLMAIAKSESINAHIGRLPPKSELLEGADIELTSKQTKTPRAYDLGLEHLVHILSDLPRRSRDDKVIPNKARQSRRGNSTPRPPLKGSSRPSSSVRVNPMTLPANDSNSSASQATGPVKHMGQKIVHKQRHPYRQNSKTEVVRKPRVETESDSESESSTESSDTN